MPWKVVRNGRKHCVVKKDTGEIVKCHATRREAIQHMRALYANYDSGRKPQQ